MMEKRDGNRPIAFTFLLFAVVDRAHSRPSRYHGHLFSYPVVGLDRSVLDHCFGLVADLCASAARQRVRFFVIALVIFGLSTPALAQIDVVRPPDTRQNLQLLAGTMGAIHYLNVLCQGRESQDWREKMVEMLELENPNYQMRATLIQSFNRGYRQQEQRFRRCGPEIDRQLQIKAEQGRILSDALADPYLH